jgi:hypothetical protein
VFEDEFDLLCAVIRNMPRFVETQINEGRRTVVHLERNHQR